jgi:circadian clock protein KaiB
MNVLIADDDDITRLLLRSALTKLGHDMQEVLNGREAWEAWQSGGFSLIITDWMMPDLNGLEFCRRIRGAGITDYTYASSVSTCDPAIRIRSRHARERSMSDPSAGRVSAGLQNREYDLRLYVAGTTSKSVSALRNLEQLCEEHLASRYHIEIIDLMKKPHLAQADQILAVPTLVRKEATRSRRIVGNLSDTQRVLTSLELRPRDADPFAHEKGGRHV